MSRDTAALLTALLFTALALLALLVRERQRR